MPKLLKFNDQAKQALMRGVNEVNDAVSATLGPRGNNVAFDRPWGPPTVVHDGVTVAKEVDLVDKFENMGAQLVKEAAQKTNDLAGDGTTTATILAQAIVKGALKNIAAGSNAMMLRRGIDKAVEAVTGCLDTMATKIKTDKEIEQVAVISAQDEQIGKMIAKTVNKLGKDAVITVEEGGTREITVEFKEGMEFDRGFVSPYFITKPEDREATVESPYILITDKRISSMQEFLPFIEMFMKASKPKGPDLVIICEELAGEPLATLIVNKIKGNIRVLVTTAPGYGDKRKSLLEDISIVTGAKFISQELGIKLESITMEDLGKAGRVTSTKDNTLIVDGGGDPLLIEERISSIKNEIEKPDLSEFDKEKLQERLAKLTSGVAIISVGANSETEMREKKERCIDAISATKAALEEGIVPGGLTSLVRAADTIEIDGLTREEEIGVEIVGNACQEPFRKLMSNSGFDPGKMLERLLHTKPPFGIDVIDGESKDLIKSGIIDPVKVTKSALRNAASVGIMIMTTSVLIVDKPEEKDKKPLAVN